MQHLSRRLLVGFVSSIIALGLVEAGFRALLIVRFERALAAFEHDLWVTEPGTRHLYTLRPAATNENRVSPELADVQVINAGTPGFNTMQEASYLASRWDELQPDIVVLGLVMNDAEPTRIVPRDPRMRFADAPLWLVEEFLLRTGWTDG